MIANATRMITVAHQQPFGKSLISSSQSLLVTGKSLSFLFFIIRVHVMKIDHPQDIWTFRHDRHQYAICCILIIGMKVV